METPYSQLVQRLLTLTPNDFATRITRLTDSALVATPLTVFFEALTLDALLATGDTTLTLLTQRLAGQIRHQRSALGTWNYWPRTSPEAQQRPLPDDLDTTTCAMNALATQEGTVPASWVADLVQVLTLREAEVGGPYKTWITTSVLPDWQDVDPVVNANIGRLLAKIGASPPPLMAYLASIIKDQTIVSPYYPNRAALRYFLASWYRGEAEADLVAQCESALQQAIGQASAHHLALALATVALLRQPDQALVLQGRVRLEQLLAAPLEAGVFYIDAVHGESHDGASSTAFTLSLCVQALGQAQRLMAPATSPAAVTPDPTKPLRQEIIAGALKLANELPEALISRLVTEIEKNIAVDGKDNLTLLPFRLAHMVTGRSAAYDLAHASLGTAHLLGWIAYTLYDDVVDGDEPTEKLYLANTCSRLGGQLFAQAFPGDHAWQQAVTECFVAMDAMSTTEQTAWRLKPGTDGWILPAVLPYPSQAFLSERSCGVHLAPLALLRRLGASAEVMRCATDFITHLVAARQLCDDAHDWESDLAQGRLNAVSVLLFETSRAGTPFDLAFERDALRQTFWRTGLDDVTVRVQAHCEVARRLSGAFAPLAPAVVDALLNPLIASMKKAVTERDQALAFLDAYKQKTTSREE